MSIEVAKRVFEIESEAIKNLISRLDENFPKAVELIDGAKGRVVVTGMGKSGLIGKKIASTFASVGVPALFLHAAEGIHGDLGMIVKDDLVIAISNSGETEEIVTLIPNLKRFGNKLIGITGKIPSTLSRESDIVLDVSVEKEACSLGLVPTASTTATLAMGDALAMAIIEKRGFKKDDFALFHPGGSIGKRLLLKVKDLYHTGKEIPIVKENAPFKDIIFEISSKRLGVTAVVNDTNTLIGIITDGDLRRLMEKKLDNDIFNTKASEFMTANPKIIESEALATKALQIMEQYSITSILSINDKKEPMGIIHLHDLLKAGVV
jgi:arabinose-5-phosphate isomerase